MTNKEFYRRRREAGLCVECGEPAIKSRCQGCSEKAKQAYRDRKAKGLCNCGKPTDQGYAQCQQCKETARLYALKVLRQRAAAGQCISCGGINDDPKGRKNCQRCLKLIKAKIRRLRAAGQCLRCYKPAENGMAMCRACKERAKRRHDDFRRKVFERYGGAKCACCGETIFVFLTIDHTNNDGAKHRKEVGRAAYNICRWLHRNGYPPGFQVLCMNCNWAKRFGPCPHQVMREARQRGSSSTKKGHAD